jgi:protein gp37
MSTTKIEWADRVWNPVTGCTKVSEGCRHCYAERIAGRFWGERKFSDVQCDEVKLNDPLHWRKPSRIFVNSMSDLFHPDVPDGFIFGAFMRMAHDKCQKHTFMILTKRPERMQKWISKNWMTDFYDKYHEDLALPNVWLGVSVEDQKTADERIPLLLKTPAAVRFVSIEPMLGPVDLQYINGALASWYQNGSIDVVNKGHLDWVICGGESGPGSRPMHPDWVRSIRDNCHEAGIPFFFKQWGEWWPGEIGRLYDVDTNNTTGWTDGQSSYRIGRKEAGRLLDGVEWNEYPTEDK